ncbi:MAG: septum formation initiator family protein [Paludibacteraceae bacterium]
MKFSRDIFQKVPKMLLNKYLIVIAVFFVFLTFFDHNNLITRWKTGDKINEMKKEIDYYQTEIDNNKKKMVEMRSSSETLEKYAREEYNLKKDSEDIYIIHEEDEKK